MWILKLETKSKNTVLTNIAIKYKISFSGYPLSYRTKGNHLIVQTAGFIDSNQGDIKKLISEFERLNIVRNISCHNDFVIASFYLPKWLKVLYQPEIIFIRPARYDSSGKEILELGCWSKEPLIKLIKTFKEKYATKVISIVKKDVRNISFVSLHPNLTNKQKTALKLAIDNGYYHFPRLITIKELAKLMKISFSTYQAHLTKAEANFIPHMFGKME